MVAVDTLLVEDLDRMMDFELVCQWCESPAEYMWRHNDVVHFNCGDCAEENMEIREELIFEGSTHGWCVTCKSEINIVLINFVKI
jgi:peptide subunit release factor 1 (eRF1)